MFYVPFLAVTLNSIAEFLQTAFLSGFIQFQELHDLFQELYDLCISRILYHTNKFEVF